MLYRSGKALLVLVLVAWFVPAYAKPVKKDAGPGEFEIDLSPINKAKGILDCKFTFISQTTNKDMFQRGVTIKGPATEHTAEDVTRILKMLYEFQEWDVKEMGKTKLLVIGKKGSAVTKMEMRAEGLAKEFFPAIMQTKAKP